MQRKLPGTGTSKAAAPVTFYDFSLTRCSWRDTPSSKWERPFIANIGYRPKILDEFNKHIVGPIELIASYGI